MSDVMLFGVLEMPPELWGDDPLDKMQRHSRYVQAASEIRKLRAEVEALRVLIGDAADELESVYDEMFPWREEYPDEMRRYENEMRLVNRIINALRGEGE